MKPNNHEIFNWTTLFLIIGILMSFKLWVNDRSFPLIPVVEGLQVPKVLSYLQIIFLIGGLILNCFYKKRWITILLIILMGVLAFEDQMRWQPWYYHYLVFLFPFCLKSKHINITYFQLILIGIYFWGGIHKINENFVDNVFPYFYYSLTGIEWIWNNKIGYLIPLVEISIALGLMNKSTRKWVIYIAIITHILIIVFLSPFGMSKNSIVIPWNIAMIIFLYLCFKKTTRAFNLRELWADEYKYVKSIVLVLFLIFPILNFWNKWDHYLSFNLYSDKHDLFCIAVEKSQTERLDFDYQQSLVEIPGLEGGIVIDVNEWAIKELNVPMPPEHRIHKRIAKHFCARGFPNDKVAFLEIKKPIESGMVNSFSCDDLYHKTIQK